MVQRITPPKIIVVPRDGEIEIKLDITINVNNDGSISTSVVRENEKIEKIEEEKNDKFFIPDFTSGNTLKFGKED